MREASAALKRRCAEELGKLGLPWTLPFADYARFLPPHDAFRVLLRDMAELYGARGVPTGPLAAAAERYDGWLKERRGEFRRRRSLDAGWLRERFLNALELEALDAALGNPKLAAFSRELFLKGKRFDYLRLSLAD